MASKGLQVATGTSSAIEHGSIGESSLSASSSAIEDRVVGVHTQGLGEEGDGPLIIAAKILDLGDGTTVIPWDKKGQNHETFNFW